MSEPASESVLKRAEELNALDAILPFVRRGRLAALLTNDDVATLKHLASEGEVISFRALLLGLLESGTARPPTERRRFAKRFVAPQAWLIRSPPLEVIWRDL